MGGNNPHGGSATTQPTATTQHASPNTGGKVGRRALIATAAVGACAVATPFVVEKGVQLSATEVKNLLQHEVGTIEGVALDDALKIAELTQTIVQHIVIPVAQLFSNVEGGALGLLIGTLQHAKQLLDFIHAPTDLLGGLIGVLQGWQTNVQLFPQALSALANGDLNHAETYLRALKAKVSDTQTTA